MHFFDHLRTVNRHHFEHWIGFFENEYGAKLSLDSYSTKWLAFNTK